MRRTCIVGTGYVGLATALGLAELGWTVCGYDTIPERIDRLTCGVSPYREAGFEATLRKHLESGRIRFFCDIEQAVQHADLVILAVSTPARDNGTADLSALHDVVSRISAIDHALRPTLVIRSTVRPGTSDDMAERVESWADVVFAPEFLHEGSALSDFLNPDRIVVGAPSPGMAVPYLRLFERLQKPVVLTSRCNAELIKCCANAFLALKIGFASEVESLCEAVGATADDVLRGIGYDRRIGFEFLRPGVLLAGPSFDNDVKMMHSVADRLGSTRELVAAILRLNAAQPRRIVDALEQELGDLRGVRVGVWGFTLRAGTENASDSLALRILEDLSSRGATTIVYDPVVYVAPLPAHSAFAATALDATAAADALMVLMAWPEFAAIDPRRYAGSLRRGLVVDGVNVLDPERVTAAGLRYLGTGRRIDEPVPAAGKSAS
jgi:UDPglucose 6-dehydrogenase